MASGGGVQECGAEHVAVQASPHHGRGLFARRAFAPGEVILRERPLVALQSLDNRQYVPCCGGCFHFLGSCRHHLMLMAEALDRSQLAAPEAAAAQREEAAVFPEASFSPLVPCAMGCGELYCSPACRDAHWARGHQLLCVGPIPDKEAPGHPLVRYKMHALQTNEIFLLVADVVALVLTRAEALGGDLQAALEPFRDFVQRPWWEVATNPDPGSDPVAFQSMLKGLVQEACTLLAQALAPRCPPACAPLFTPEFFASVIGMFEQNNVGIRQPSPVAAALLPALAQVVAEQEQGQQQRPQQQPQQQRLEYARTVYLPLLQRMLEDWQEGEDEEDEEEEGDMHVDDGEEEEGCCAGGDHDHHHHHDHHDHGQSAAAPQQQLPPPVADPAQARALLDACLQRRGTGLFSQLDGTALLALICCMNHSCAPTCEVRWVGGLGGGPLLAELVALAPIGAGDELYQSYVKVDGTAAERRAALRDYGFLCACPRCTAEDQAAAAGGGGSA